MDRNRLITLIEIAILAAIGFIFGKIEFSYFWPQGGGVSLVMIPIAILSYRRGIGAGLVGGFLVGTLSAIFGGYVIHPIQFLLDYPIAFMVLGLAGMFNKNNLNLVGIFSGLVLAGALRFISHVLSGVVFFAEYAGDQNVWIYSSIYNGFILLEVIITTVVMVILAKSFTYLLRPQLQK